MSRLSTSVVIPTLKGNPRTVQSIPENVETIVVSDGNRAEARNIGAHRANGEILVFCDDDIAFSESFFWNTTQGNDERKIVGLRDFDFGLLLTRFLVVHRKDFEILGGFDERLNHMEDTEFSLNALSRQFTLATVPRKEVDHEPHKSAGQNRMARIRNTTYLSFNYPQYALKLWLGQLTPWSPFDNLHE